MSMEKNIDLIGFHSIEVETMSGSQNEFIVDDCCSTDWFSGPFVHNGNLPVEKSECKNLWMAVDYCRWGREWHVSVRVNILVSFRVNSLTRTEPVISCRVEPLKRTDRFVS